MAILTKYTGGSVYHLVPTEEERKRLRRLGPAGVEGIPFCGWFPREIADEIDQKDGGNVPAGGKLCVLCKRRAAKAEADTQRACD